MFYIFPPITAHRLPLSSLSAISESLYVVVRDVRVKVLVATMVERRHTHRPAAVPEEVM